MLYLVVLLIFVFFAGVAMTVGEGLWSNSILLFLVMICGLLAFVGGVPLASFVVEKADLENDDYTWHFVFACVWGVFFLSMTIFRILLENASKTRMKFVGPLEMAAGPLMGLFAAVMFTSFAAYTLERIPIQAGYWSTADASDWVVTTFAYLRAPFLNVMNAFAGAEGIDSSIIVR